MAAEIGNSKSRDNRYAPAIRKNRDLLQRSLDISLLLASLDLEWSAKDRLIDVLKPAKTTTEKIKRLLNLLCCVTDDAIADFLTELRADNQEHVANVIEGKNGKIPMTELHHNSFKRNRRQLHAFIDPYDEFYDELRDSEVFTDNDVERVECLKHDSQKSSEIVEIMMRKSDCCYDVFLSALSATLQSHVIFILTGNGDAPLSEDFRNRLQANIRRISDSLYVTNKLLNELVQQGIFTYRALDRVRCLLPNASESAAMLIKLLQRRSQPAFEKLQAALTAADHEHTAVAIFGAVINGEIRDETEKRLSATDRQALQRHLENDLNKNALIKDLGRKNDFTSTFKSGSIKVAFKCYSLSAVAEIRHQCDSKAFDSMMTDQYCERYRKQYGLTSLTLFIPPDEFKQCTAVLRRNELMTSDRRRSLQLASREHARLVKVDDSLLSKVNLSASIVAEIRAKPNLEERSKTLLEILSRRPNITFQQSIEALRATNHDSVVELILAEASDLCGEVIEPSEVSVVQSMSESCNIGMLNNSSQRGSFAVTAICESTTGSSVFKPAPAARLSSVSKLQEPKNSLSKRPAVGPSHVIEETEEMNRLMQSMRNKLKYCRTVLAMKTEVIASKEKQLIEKDRQLGDLRETLAHMENRLKDKDNKIARKNAELEDLKLLLTEKDTELATKDRVIAAKNRSFLERNGSSQESNRFDEVDSVSEAVQDDCQEDGSESRQLKFSSHAEAWLSRSAGKKRLKRPVAQERGERKSKADSGYGGELVNDSGKSSSVTCQETDGDNAPFQRSKDSFTSAWLLTHVVRGYGRSVTAVTSLADRLYIVRGKTEGRVEVYDAESCEYRRHIAIENFGDWATGLASCDVNGCLYVGDLENEVVHRVKLSSDDNVNGSAVVARWKVNGVPRGLSTTGGHNLLVTVEERLGGGPGKIEEYTADGHLVHAISLQEDVIGPRHALQINKFHYAVSHGHNGTMHRVCVVDVAGRVLRSYGHNPGSAAAEATATATATAAAAAAVRLLSKPRQLAIDKRGFIYVADSGNHRIVVLNGQLKLSATFDVAVDGGLSRPYALFLDENRQRLYVGEFDNENRLLTLSCNERLVPSGSWEGSGREEGVQPAVTAGLLLRSTSAADDTDLSVSLV